MKDCNNPSYVSIPVSNKETIVDAEMADYARSFKWCIRNGYATRYVRKGEPGWISRNKKKVVSLHAAVAQCPEGKEPDHINENRLDNRRENLRCATRAENMAARSRPSNPGASGYRGVRALRDGWAAQIGGASRRIYLGFSQDPEEAARMYDKAAREKYGEFARLNFPDTQQ